MLNNTSELSDALNPNFHRNRHPWYAERETSPLESHSSGFQNNSTYSTHSPSTSEYFSTNEETQPPVVASHRSELENAINPLRVTQPTTPSQNLPKPKPQHQSVNQEPIKVLKDILATFNSYKTAVETETKRRIKWEQEQESKLAQKETELEERLSSMQHDIDQLKNVLLRERSYSPPMIISSQASPRNNPPEEYSASSMQEAQLDVRVPNQNFPIVIDSTVDLQGTDIIFDGIPDGMRVEKASESMYRTMQAVMRRHLLRCMNTEDVQNLPKSHHGDGEYPDHLPVRLNWDLTLKRSAHNEKMKRRVIRDLLQNKTLYPLIPELEFTEQTMDTAFDQAYNSLRLLFRSQNSDTVAERVRNQEQLKSQRARRSSRKKNKLTKRTSVRKEFKQFSSSVFDAAFQLDCMSSEESGEEEDENIMDDERKPKSSILYIRYLSWRSRRLLHLYHTLDEREELERSQKPKRGSGRKERLLGLPKDGNPPPPKGLDWWMVSKVWLRNSQLQNPQITEWLDLKVGDGTTGWELQTLGESSDDDNERYETHSDYNQLPYSLWSNDTFLQ